jgi:hypothetical protein
MQNLQKSPAHRIIAAGLFSGGSHSSTRAHRIAKDLGCSLAAFA